jgi:hypothetical protein
VSGPSARRELGLRLRGFDHYAHKQRLREDDRLVRERAARSLAEALTALRRVEREARLGLPAPTRERPFPDPEALAHLRDLEQLLRDVGDLEARLRALPYPHADRTWERLRSEAAALELLLEHDLGLLSAADAVRDAAEALAARREGTSPASVRAALDRCQRALRQRMHDLDLPWT